MVIKNIFAKQKGETLPYTTQQLDAIDPTDRLLPYSRISIPAENLVKTIKIILYLYHRHPDLDYFKQNGNPNKIIQTIRDQCSDIDHPVDRVEEINNRLFIKIDQGIRYSLRAKFRRENHHYEKDGSYRLYDADEWSSDRYLQDIIFAIRRNSAKEEIESRLTESSRHTPPDEKRLKYTLEMTADDNDKLKTGPNVFSGRNWVLSDLYKACKSDGIYKSKKNLYELMELGLVINTQGKIAPILKEKGIPIIASILKK